MTLNAFGVEHGLDDFREGKWFGSPRRRFQRAGDFGRGPAVVDGGHLAAFVASDAAPFLAGLELDHATHPLEFVEVFVEGFEIEDFPGGDVEMGRAVFFDGDESERGFGHGSNRPGPGNTRCNSPRSRGQRTRHPSNISRSIGPIGTSRVPASVLVMSVREPSRS